jgi:hypothetical protein
MFVPVTRVVTLAMGGVLAFLLLVPMALQRHNTALAAGIGIVYIIYLIANVVLWQRMRPRA